MEDSKDVGSGCQHIMKLWRSLEEYLCDDDDHENKEKGNPPESVDASSLRHDEAMKNVHIYDGRFCDNFRRNEWSVVPHAPNPSTSLRKPHSNLLIAPWKRNYVEVSSYKVEAMVKSWGFMVEDTFAIRLMTAVLFCDYWKGQRDWEEMFPRR